MTTAAIPFYQEIVIRLLAEIDLLLRNFVYNGYSALSDYLRVPLGIISAMYIALLGYSVMVGWVRLSMGNFIKAALKIGFIYMAVTEWSWVSEYFVGFINSAIGGLADALLSATNVHIPAAGGIDGGMQITLIQFTKLGSKVFNTGGLGNFGAWIDGIVIWAFGYIIVGLALFELILAKVMLAVLFVFTPLMVIFCYFRPFQTFFDRWLGAIVGFALLQLFVSAALVLALSISYWWLALHFGETALQIGNAGTLPLVIVGILCIGLILKAASLAQNLGGIVSTSSASGLVAGIIGGAVGSTLSTGRSLSPVLSPFTSAGKKAVSTVGRTIMSDLRSPFNRGDK